MDLSCLSKKLKEIVDVLRSENGCPWDKSQTIKSLSQYILEEVYEVYDAMENKDIENLKEELGDILSQVYMISRIAEEEGLFCLEDVYTGIIEKLFRRHPHVFGDKKAYSSSEALKYWNEKKNEEKKNNKIRALPTLIYAMKIINKKGLIYNKNILKLIDDFKKLSNKFEIYLNKTIENNKRNNDKVNLFNEEFEMVIAEFLFKIILIALLIGFNPDFALRKYLEEKFSESEDDKES
ncbi:MAG: MazG family protein [Spirochaetes bacterium]|nr:MazG family protein [Spirochaetota bacterium]